MPGLVPGIHVLCVARRGVDGRDKPGHDGVAHASISSAQSKFGAECVSAPDET
ncbi:hypothetical protein M2175_007497 [Bradyrhizobium elkanii]|nr:hypothetical protein [Bradyrhizobium elkanii]MCS3973024.1 hypothetical protein [Bradyrhizobium japonicum]